MGSTLFWTSKHQSQNKSSLTEFVLHAMMNMDIHNTQNTLHTWWTRHSQHMEHPRIHCIGIFAALGVASGMFYTVCNSMKAICSQMNLQAFCVSHLLHQFGYCQDAVSSFFLSGWALISPTLTWRLYLIPQSNHKQLVCYTALYTTDDWSQKSPLRMNEGKGTDICWVYTVW